MALRIGAERTETETCLVRLPWVRQGDVCAYSARACSPGPELQCTCVTHCSGCVLARLPCLPILVKCQVNRGLPENSVWRSDPALPLLSHLPSSEAGAPSALLQLFTGESGQDHVKPLGCPSFSCSPE